MVPLIIVAVLSALAVAAPVLEDDKQIYPTKYDHVNIEMILNNPRLVKYYSACLLSKGPCSPEGLEFKRILPDAIQTNCRKCTQKQKVTTLQAIKRLQKEYTKIWNQLQVEWDPDDIYVTKFLDTNSQPSVSDMFSDRFDGEDSSESNQDFLKESTESWNSSNGTSTTLRVFSSSPPTLGPTKVNPISNDIGQGLKATVSLGSNIVNQVMRNIRVVSDTVVLTGAQIAGNIGKRVIQTGTEIANIIKEIATPKQRVYHK